MKSSIAILHMNVFVVQKEWWLVRSCISSSDDSDEELYVSGNLVVWSRGNFLSSDTVQVVRSFTVDSPVNEACPWQSLLSLCIFLSEDLSLRHWSLLSLHYWLMRTGTIQWLGTADCCTKVYLSKNLNFSVCLSRLGLKLHYGNTRCSPELAHW